MYLDNHERFSIQHVPKIKVNILGGHSTGHCKQKKSMYPIPNGFRDRAILLYSSKIVDKKEILRSVSNTGDKVSTVCLVRHIFENSTVNISALCNSLRTWRVARQSESKLLYSEIALSRKLFRIGYMYIYTYLLRMTSQNTDLSS
jgi:hypothetical protein